jgi:hypothetical protein
MRHPHVGCGVFGPLRRHHARASPLPMVPTALSRGFPSRRRGPAAVAPSHLVLASLMRRRQRGIGVRVRETLELEVGWTCNLCRPRSYAVPAQPNPASTVPTSRFHFQAVDVRPCVPFGAVAYFQRLLVPLSSVRATLSRSLCSVQQGLPGQPTGRVRIARETRVSVCCFALALSLPSSLSLP